MNAGSCYRWSRASRPSIATYEYIFTEVREFSQGKGGEGRGEEGRGEEGRGNKNLMEKWAHKASDGYILACPASNRFDMGCTTRRMLMAAEHF